MEKLKDKKSNNELTVNPFNVFPSTAPQVEQGGDVLLIPLQGGEPNLDIGLGNVRKVL